MKEGLLKCSGAEAGERFARNQFFIGLTSPNWVVSMWPCGLPFNSPKKGFSNKKHTHTGFSLFVAVPLSLGPVGLTPMFRLAPDAFPLKLASQRVRFLHRRTSRAAHNCGRFPTCRLLPVQACPWAKCFPSLIVKTAFSKCADWVLAISSPGSICVSTPLTSRSSPSTGGPLE